MIGIAANSVRLSRGLLGNKFNKKSECHGIIRGFLPRKEGRLL